MTHVPRPPYRFDHVGSLLRPEALLNYREEWKKGELSLEQLRVHEDDCIRHAVRLQEEVGLESITDGEYRRESFHVDFITQIDIFPIHKVFTCIIILTNDNKITDTKNWIGRIFF